MKIKLLDMFPHYWICGICAKERGGSWPEGHVASVSKRKCEYCEGKNHLPSEFIAPWVDYDWKDHTANKYANIARD